MNTQHITSADGTRIAFSVSGSGRAVVLVDGALCHRAMGPAESLAAALPGFTAHAYDRRGRGESDAGVSPYTVDREIDDR
jgi:pimeloyl-ACP methyl ester carboxylesterase